MRVLQINNCHYRRGGADVVYQNTGKLLEDYGHDVSYFSIKNTQNQSSLDEKYFVSEVDFINVSLFQKLMLIPRFFYSFEAKNKLEKLLKLKQPEVAHVHLYKGGLTTSIFQTLRKFRIPVVISLHDFGFLDPHNLLLDGKLNISEKTIHGSAFYCFFQKSNRNSYFFSLLSTLEYLFHSYFFPFDKTFDTILAVSKFSQSKHLESKKFNWEIDHLYNFSPLLDKRETKVVDNDGYLLYFGRLSKEKGVATLITAFSNLNCDINLKIVGNGNLYEEFKDRLVNDKINNIELLGFKDGDELYNIIKGASYVVVPSEWYENNPMTIIESYCYGVPVIGSRVGGIPEIIEEGVTGFTFEMANVKDLMAIIIKAINVSDEIYTEMCLNARKFAEINFSPKIHCGKLINIYNRTIAKLHKNG